MEVNQSQVTQQPEAKTSSQDTESTAKTIHVSLPAATALNIVSVLALCVAVIFSFLPWIELNPLITGGSSLLGGLAGLFGADTASLSTISSSYSVFSFADLAQALRQLSDFLVSLSESSEYISLGTDELSILSFVDRIIALLYIYIVLWAISLIFTAASIIVDIVSKGQRANLLAIASSALFALAAIWATLYNVALAYVDDLNSVLSGISLFSICCAIFSMIALLCLWASWFLRRQSYHSLTSKQPGDSPARNKTKPVTLIIATAVVVLVLIADVICALSGYPFAPSVDSANTSTHNSSSGSASNKTTEPDNTMNLVSKDSVAATINGAELKEQDITDYVEDFRENSDLLEEDAWIDWLNENDYTPESVRAEVVDYYIDQYLEELACDEYDIVVTDDEVSEYLNSLKELFDSEEDFKDALAEIGLTEAEYKDTAIIPNLRKEKLMEVITGTQYDDEEELNADYQLWFEELKNQMDIEINPMPQGLSYDTSGKKL